MDLKRKLEEDILVAEIRLLETIELQISTIIDGTGLTFTFQL